jgi:hypothetical protein
MGFMCMYHPFHHFLNTGKKNPEGNNEKKIKFKRKHHQPSVNNVCFARVKNQTNIKQSLK